MKKQSTRILKSQTCGTLKRSESNLVNKMILVWLLLYPSLLGKLREKQIFCWVTPPLKILSRRKRRVHIISIMHHKSVTFVRRVVWNFMQIQGVTMTWFLFIFATACCLLKRFHSIYIGISLEISGMHGANSKDSGVDQLFTCMYVSQVLLFSATVNELQSKQSSRVQKKPFALADNILVSLISVSLNIFKIFCCKSFLFNTYTKSARANEFKKHHA